MTFNLNVAVNVNFPKPLEVVVKGDGTAEEAEELRKKLAESRKELATATAAATSDLPRT